MKRFRFGLARLERLREMRRREARARLAGAIAEARARMRRVESEREALRGAMHADSSETAHDAGSLKQLAAWRESLHAGLETARAELAEAEEAVRDAHGKHTEAAREHRVLERLREKRYRRWLEEAELEERKFLDEAHLLRMGRQRSNQEDGR